MDRLSTEILSIGEMCWANTRESLINEFQEYYSVYITYEHIQGLCIILNKNANIFQTLCRYPTGLYLDKLFFH